MTTDRLAAMLHEWNLDYTGRCHHSEGQGGCRSQAARLAAAGVTVMDIQKPSVAQPECYVCGRTEPHVIDWTEDGPCDIDWHEDHTYDDCEVTRVCPRTPDALRDPEACTVCGKVDCTSRHAQPVPDTLRAEISDNQAALESLPYTVQGADLNLPHRVVVDQHGHYWRDYGEFLSMPPVSDENRETEVVAAFTLAQPAPDALRHICEDCGNDGCECRSCGGHMVAQPAPDALRAAAQRWRDAEDALQRAAEAATDDNRLTGEWKMAGAEYGRAKLALRAALGDEP